MRFSDFYCDFLYSFLEKYFIRLLLFRIRRVYEMCDLLVAIYVILCAKIIYIFHLRKCLHLFPLGKTVAFQRV